MRHLDLPAGADDDFIHRQCRREGWEGYSERWTAATAAYSLHGGDPWHITAAPFNPQEQARLRSLYQSRRNSPQIAAIRRPPGRLSCAVCGSNGSPSLDHALPRAEFPEFSILLENLIPACGSCNSEEKGDRYRGEESPERFIHPYYDEWCSMPLWQVRFSGDPDAVLFDPEPLPEVPDQYRRIVEFHLAHVLGREWRDSCARTWGGLPAQVHNRLRGTITRARVRDELAVRLADEIIENGENGWTPAFLRGLLASDAMVLKLIERVRAIRHASTPIT